MKPLEREKLESLKSKLSNENLSEEARKRAAKEAMNYADQFPGEKKELLNEAFEKSKFSEGKGPQELLKFHKLKKDGIVSENTNLVWFTFEEMYKTTKIVSMQRNKLRTFKILKIIKILEKNLMIYSRKVLKKL